MQYQTCSTRQKNLALDFRSDFLVRCTRKRYVFCCAMVLLVTLALVSVLVCIHTYVACIMYLPSIQLKDKFQYTGTCTCCVLWGRIDMFSAAPWCSLWDWFCSMRLFVLTLKWIVHIFHSNIKYLSTVELQIDDTNKWSIYIWILLDPQLWVLLAACTSVQN